MAQQARTTSDTLSVRQLISERRSQGSERQSRRDPFHLALVIEGGGMRGVVAGGMVSGIEDLGLLPVFDSIHGSSAGACAGAYLLAGQAKQGTSIYYEDINNKSFIHLWRGLIGRPIMNTSFLIDHVMRYVKPLNVDEIRRHPGVLHVVATRALTGEPIVFLHFTDTDDFFRKLKASISIPVIAGKGVYIGDELIYDGGMAQQIPIISALENGATHILVLMTRRDHEVRRPVREHGFAFDEIVIRLVYGAVAAREYRDRNKRTNHVVTAILARDLRGKGKNVAVDYVLRPSTGVHVDRLSTDGALLRAAAEEAQNAVINYFKV